MTPIEKLRAYLLPKTLEHAVQNSPFWAAFLGEAWKEVSTPAELARLPLLLKATAIEHQAEMRCGPDATDFGSVSSGTTRIGDRLFRVERVPAELEALAELHEMLRADVEVDEARPPPPLVLHILTPNHGLPTSAPGPDTLRLAWASSSHLFDMAVSALTEPVGERRVSVIRASVSVLKQLTVWLAQQGTDPRSFGITDLGTNAGLVTRRWRGLLERAWGANVWDNYSLSEVVTPATECAECHRYHFTEPPLLWEVIDPITRAPVSPGETGLLVVTALYPYVQRQPLIRYVTGDLVEVGPACALAGEAGFSFQGRLHQSIFDEHEGRARHLLPSAVLEDTADDFEQIARTPHASETLGLVPGDSVGQPKVRSTARGGDVLVTLGTSFLPALFPDAGARLTSAVRDALLERIPALAAASASGARRLVVELEHAPREEESTRWFGKHLL